MLHKNDVSEVKARCRKGLVTKLVSGVAVPEQKTSVKQKTSVQLFDGTHSACPVVCCSEAACNAWYACIVCDSPTAKLQPLSQSKVTHESVHHTAIDVSDTSECVLHLAVWSKMYDWRQTVSCECRACRKAYSHS